MKNIVFIRQLYMVEFHLLTPPPPPIWHYFLFLSGLFQDTHTQKKNISPPLGLSISHNIHSILSKKNYGSKKWSFAFLCCMKWISFTENELTFKHWIDIYFDVLFFSNQCSTNSIDLPAKYPVCFTWSAIIVFIELLFFCINDFRFALSLYSRNKTISSKIPTPTPWARRAGLVPGVAGGGRGMVTGKSEPYITWRLANV